MKPIKSMKYDELLKAKMQIEAAIYSLIDTECQQLKKAMYKVEALVSTRGTKGSRLATGKSLKGRKLPVRFRNPKNREETWAGRGLKPKWLVAALKGGKKKLSDFAVN